MKKKKARIKFAAQDYLPSLLPSTRKEQFSDIFRHEWRALLSIGAILVLFALPYLFLILFKGVFLPAYTSSLDASLSDTEIHYLTARTSVFLDAFAIPCMMIFSVGLSGCARIFRLMSGGEGFVFRGDFFKGIRQNVRQYLLVFFLFSLGIFLSEFLYAALFGATGNSSQAYLISFFPFVIVCFFFGPMGLFHLHQAAVYSMKTSQYVRNAAKMSVGCYSWSLLFVIIPFAAYFLLCLFGLNFILESIIVTVLVLLVLPVYLLFVSQAMSHLFDRHLNRKSHPELYRKGLYNGSDGSAS